jgi:hypothetical protein
MKEDQVQPVPALKMALLLLAVFSVFMISRPMPGVEPVDPSPGLKRIYIVHFSHTDFGFTEMESVTRDLHRRYLDIALDAVLATRNGPDDQKFYWTAEALVAVQDWWNTASPSRRRDFLSAVRSGQLEVTALPFNQTPFLNQAQWRTMLHWIPDDLWNRLKPTAGLQNDVNGFPRAGAMALLDRGVGFLGMGINGDNGGPPFRRPSAFRWKMPDGRRLFVWLSDHYGSGYDYFETSEWRRGPVPAAADTRYRPPRAGDFFRTDEESLRSAHRQCQRKIADLKKSGYPYEVLTVFTTSQWRMDNDPPFPPLADFVAAWNRLGLRPELRLATLSRAMKAMEAEIGPGLPEYEGEFTDWWANGSASAPREVAASRKAKRLLDAAQSPLWGNLSDASVQALDTLYKDLCLFDEHTWGSSWSVAIPDGFDTSAQFSAKSIFAYRPLMHGEWLLSQRVRTRLLAEGEGFFVANSAKQPFSGWVRMPASCLRADFKSLEEPHTGSRIPIFFENGIKPWTRPQNSGELSRENSAATFSDNIPNQVAKFWLEKLEGNSFRKLRLSTQTAGDATERIVPPAITTDGNGWPESAQWPSMKKPLFLSGLCDFAAIKVNSVAPRWALRDIAETGDLRLRDRLRNSYIEETAARAENQTTMEETPNTLIYTQPFRHPRLRWAVRIIELWKREPRARITLRFYRLSSDEPEFFYALFPLPCKGTLPRASCGGISFVPFSDQLPGSCRDYFAIDGWVEYATPEGHWLWVSRDAPLVTFGAPNIWTRRTSAPADTNRLLAILFDNSWYTNFVGNEHGAMEFQFDLAWRDGASDDLHIADWADSLLAEPEVLINSAGVDTPLMMRRLFRP